MPVSIDFAENIKTGMKLARDWEGKDIVKVIHITRESFVNWTGKEVVSFLVRFDNGWVEKFNHDAMIRFVKD